MAPPTMTSEDLGAFYAGPGGTVWRLIAYADQPTATLECVFSPDGREPRGHVAGVVGATIFDGYERLATVPRADEQVARCAYPGCPTAYASPQPELRGAVVASTPTTTEYVFACPSHVGWLLESASDYLLSKDIV